ncbi:hypothetical protein [Aeromicrobium massiliense]|uniref:hypothetical protein n=1 Tax=Aeromicrobium massiliense TaxID=1464554 RepID=UPI0002F54DA3|nr:hypothetical protein [Aeromicrobium massiliense]
MNRPILRWLSATALSGLVAATLVAPMSAASAAPAPAAFCADGSQPMVTQDEAVAFPEGEPVTGLTVVKGTQPVGFTGEYVGHVADALGKGVDMLLFELSGAGIDTGNPRAGIWAGMSGSPVYAQDGRLIGAVAYGLTGDNLPIAGVTPAEYMKQTGVDRSAPARVALTRSALSGASAATERQLAGTSLPKLKTRKVVAGGAKGNALANRTLKRVPGTSATARAARAGGFASVAAPTVINDPLVAGGNVAIGYSTGDLFSGGVGTVTAICGSTVWAFGHAMDFAGETQLSIHNASAALIVPDSTGTTGSFKQVSQVGQQIGTVNYDGYGALRGQIGRVSGFPVTTNVLNAAGKRIDTYAGTVVNQDMAPFAAAYAPAFAAVDTLDNSGTGTVRLVWRINYTVRGGRAGSLINTDVYSARGGELGDYLATGIGNDVASLMGTDLADVTITSVTSHLTLQSAKSVTYRHAGAQRWTGGKWVWANGTTVKKGQTIHVRPVYRQYVNGRPQGTSVGTARAFAISKTARGTVKVTYAAKSQQVPEGCEMDEEGDIWCDDEFGEEEEPRTFAQLLKQLDALVPSTHGVVNVSWKWKSKRAKGVKEREGYSVAPGAITGTYTAGIRVR